MSTVQMERRAFLKISVAASGGLLIGLYLPGAHKLAVAEEQSESSFMPNAFPAYRHRRTSNRDREPLGNGARGLYGVADAACRRAGCGLEQDRLRIGAGRCQVQPSDLWHANYGRKFERIFRVRTVSQRGSGRSGDADRGSRAAMECRSGESAYGIRNSTRSHESQVKLRSARRSRSKDDTPRKGSLKDPEAFRLIGTPAKRLDTPEKINGKAVFGIDVKNPGMLSAVGCPRSGLWRKGKLR